MRSTGLRIVAVLLVAATLGACRAAPIHNIRSAYMATSPQATLEDVTRAIQRAGAGLGWQMSPSSPGHIEGRLSIRTHIAVVDVSFDTVAFSITYVNSTNLNYTGTTIHKNYNGWIQNLEHAILAQTSVL